MEWMDEWDPDWPGDPKISTLKKMAFEAKTKIQNLEDAVLVEVAQRKKEDGEIDAQLKNTLHALDDILFKIRRENNISNLYFQDKISKEEAKRLWDLYKSPDKENHKVADAAIEQLTLKE